MNNLKINNLVGLHLYKLITKENAFGVKQARRRILM